MVPVKIETRINPRHLFDVDKLLFNAFLIEEECVRVIDDGVNRAVRSVGDLLSHFDAVKTVVGLERYSPETQELLKDIATTFDHHGPMTMHLYASPADSVSFGPHTDPDDVLVCLLEGEKQFDIDGTTFEMRPGAFYHIPVGTTHHAVSVGENGAVMLSIGLERFLRDKADI